MELLPPTETMYRALLDRDSSFEGIFFVAVRTDRNLLSADLHRKKAGT